MVIPNFLAKNKTGRVHDCARHMLNHSKFIGMPRTPSAHAVVLHATHWPGSLMMGLIADMSCFLVVMVVTLKSRSLPTINCLDLWNKFLQLLLTFVFFKGTGWSVFNL